MGNVCKRDVTIRRGGVAPPAGGETPPLQWIIRRGELCSPERIVHLRCVVGAAPYGIVRLRIRRGGSLRPPADNVGRGLALAV